MRKVNTVTETSVRSTRAKVNNFVAGPMEAQRPASNQLNRKITAIFTNEMDQEVDFGSLMIDGKREGDRAKPPAKKPANRIKIGGPARQPKFKDFDLVTFT